MSGIIKSGGTKMKKAPKAKKDGLISTAAAAEKLGITDAQFRRIAGARGIEADGTYTNPHYRSGPPASLWSSRTLARLARTKDVAEARETRGGKAPKDYSALFAKRYVDRNASLPDACEALFNLNRYTRHSTCSAANREEILALKSSLIEHLYRLERFTDRVEKLTKRLPEKECFCSGVSDCEKCDGTGIFQQAREVASYVFTFTLGEHARYTWMQPDFAMTFEPRVEETRIDDGKRGELETTINIPRSKLAEAKALVRYALN
jgi:hypothetical protein